MQLELWNVCVVCWNCTWNVCVETLLQMYVCDETVLEMCVMKLHLECVCLCVLHVTENLPFCFKTRTFQTQQTYNPHISTKNTISKKKITWSWMVISHKRPNQTYYKKKEIKINRHMILVIVHQFLDSSPFWEFSANVTNVVVGIEWRLGTPVGVIGVVGIRRNPGGDFCLFVCVCVCVCGRFVLWIFCVNIFWCVCVCVCKYVLFCWRCV